MIMPHSPSCSSLFSLKTAVTPLLLSGLPFSPHFARLCLALTRAGWSAILVRSFDGEQEAGLESTPLLSAPLRLFSAFGCTSPHRVEMRSVDGTGNDL